MKGLWLLIFLTIPICMISQVPSVPGFPTVPGIPSMPSQIPQQFPQQLLQQQLPQQLPQQGPLPQPQVGLPGPLKLPTIHGNFKLPDWLKRGLVVYYKVSGSSKLGNQSSAFAGINVFVVWETSNNKIVGDWISLSNDGMLIQSGLKELGRSSDSIFHVNPKYAKALLRSAGNLKNSGVTIQGVQNQQLIGVPDIGPHYVNPSLLSNDVIFDLKQIGLRLVVVGRDYNGVTLEPQYRMMPLIRSVVDPRTGLITYMEQFIPNMGSIKSYLKM